MRLEFAGKDILVIGTKRSGMGAIELLRKIGARVRAMDSQPLSTEEAACFAAMNVPVALQQDANVGRIASFFRPRCLTISQC